MPLGASRHRDTSRTVNAAEGKLRALIGKQIDAIIAQGKFRSQSEIARELSVAPNWLSMMKVGRGPVSLDILPGMAKTLDLDLGQLIGRDPRGGRQGRKRAAGRSGPLCDAGAMYHVGRRHILGPYPPDLLRRQRSQGRRCVKRS